MTILEQKFFETVPILLRLIVEELRAIKEELKKDNEEI